MSISKNQIWLHKEKYEDRIREREKDLEVEKELKRICLNFTVSNRSVSENEKKALKIFLSGKGWPLLFLDDMEIKLSDLEEILLASLPIESILELAEKGREYHASFS